MKYINDVLALVIMIGLLSGLKVVIKKFESKIRIKHNVILLSRSYWNTIVLIFSCILFSGYFTIGSYGLRLGLHVYKTPLYIGWGNIIIILALLGFYYSVGDFLCFNSDGLIVYEGLNEYTVKKYSSIQYVYLNKESKNVWRGSEMTISYNMFTKYGELFEINDLYSTFTPSEFKAVDSLISNSEFYMSEEVMNTNHDSSSVIMANINENRSYKICNDIEYLLLKVNEIES